MAHVAPDSVFYELAEADYIGWINCEPVGHVILHFYSGVEDASAIYNVYVYLLNARISDINIACEPVFPALVSVEEQHFPDNPIGFDNLVKFNCEKGSFSVFYESVSFNRNKITLGRVQPEQKP